MSRREGSLGRDKKEAGTDPAYEPSSHTVRLGFELTVYYMASQTTRSGHVGIGSYGVVSNEREGNLVGAGLYGFSPQSRMES
jgi:hypothetical protein